MPSVKADAPPLKAMPAKVGLTRLLLLLVRAAPSKKRESAPAVVGVMPPQLAMSDQLLVEVLPPVQVRLAAMAPRPAESAAATAAALLKTRRRRER